MKNMMEYKGYLGSVAYSEKDEVFFGRVEYIRDLVSFEGESAKEIKAAFIEAVDDYLETCEEDGRNPDEPFKGSFNVRTGSLLHRQVALLAKKKGENLNQLVIQALEEFLKNEERV